MLLPHMQLRKLWLRRALPRLSALRSTAQGRGAAAVAGQGDGEFRLLHARAPSAAGFFRELVAALFRRHPHDRMRKASGSSIVGATSMRGCCSSSVQMAILRTRTSLTIRRGPEKTLDITLCSTWALRSAKSSSPTAPSFVGMSIRSRQFFRARKAAQTNAGMSFQRPVLTGFDDPACDAHPLHIVWGFAYHMLVNTTTFRGMARLYNRPRAFRATRRRRTPEHFNAVLKGYRNDDPDSLRKYMPAEEYLKFVDSQEEKTTND